jgi:hypothetical protein
MTIKDILEEVYDEAIDGEHFTFGGIVCHTLRVLEKHGYLDLKDIDGAIPSKGKQ